MKSIITSCIITIMLFAGLSMPAKADTVDNFQVYLKKEIVLRESDYRPDAPFRYLFLKPSNLHDTIFVNYNHCTAGTSGRKIVIWYGEDILFSRSFPDEHVEPLMAIPINDIAGINNRPANNSAMVMRYYDDQLHPDGEILAMIRSDSLLSSQPATQGQSSTQGPAKQPQKGQPVLEWAVAALMTLVLLFLVFRKITKKPA